MSQTQFRAFLDAIDKTGEQRSVNLEEEHRKTAYPETCSAECPHRTCGFYTLENFGKPCQMQWQQHENKPTPQVDPTKPPTTPSLEQRIEKVIEKAMNPYLARLEKLENTPDPHVTRSLTPTLNGERLRIDRGMNQSRICYD